MTGELPFVGRGRELSSLRASLDESAAGARRTVLLTGEAGVGKTRLVEAFVADASTRHPKLTLLHATCFQESSVPYLPLVTALRPIGDMAALLRPLTDDAPDRSDQRQLKVYLGAGDALQAAVSRGPVLLVVDDLHWADRGTVELLGHLLHTGDRMMTLLVQRPLGTGPHMPLVDRIRRSDWHDEIALTGLDALALHELVESLTGERPGRRLLDGLAEASGGNPLLVRSLLSRLDASGVLTRRGGRLTYRGGDEVLAGPSELDTVLRHRISGLSRQCIDLLVLAAFLGENASLDDLRAVSRADATRFDHLVDEAIAAGVLVESDTIHFDHPQLRFVLRQRPRGQRRQELHLRVADHLDAVHGDDPAHAIALANHLRNAGDLVEPDRVLRACVRAASHAAAVVAWGEAAPAYDAAIEAEKRLESAPSGFRALLHTRAAYAHWYNHDNPTAEQHALAAIDIARDLGDAALWSDALVTLARARWSGDAGWGTSFDLKPFDDFLTTFEDRDPGLRARVHYARASLLLQSTDADGARIDLELATNLTDPDDTALAGQLEFTRGALALAELRPADALARFERGHDLDAAAGNELYRVAAMRAAATTLLTLGSLDDAADAAHAAMAAGPPISAWAECANSTAIVAGVAVAKGDFAEGEHMALEAERMMRWAGYPAAAQLVYSVLACGRALQGDYAGAHAALDSFALLQMRGLDRVRALVHALAGEHDAVRPFRPRPSRPAPMMFEVAALAAAVEIGDAIDDLERIAWAAPGLDFACQRGMRFDLGWCFFLPRLSAVAAARLGRADEATRRFDVAAAEAQRSGAAFELTRLERDRARLLGPM